MAVGAIEKNRESFVNRARWKLLQATEKKWGGELRYMRCPVQLNFGTKLKLYCIAFCLYIYDLFDGIISNSEYKES
jgi:hypothetical protein